MGLSNILYLVRYPIIISLGLAVSFILKRIFPKRSFTFQTIASFIICVIIITAFFIVSAAIDPLDYYFPQVKISTLDNDNPKAKEITYSVDIINRTNKDVDVILTFTRQDSELYPYINLIPESYTSEKVTIKANERKDYSTSFTIDSEDSRLINSYYLKMKVKYKIQ